MAEPSENGNLRFGAFELRAAQRQLLQHGQPVVLGARAFDVLLALAAQRGRSCTKGELLAAVWPGQVVEENNLTVQVSALRKLLGPGAIATIPGRGYQFTADVTASAAALPVATAEPVLFGRDTELQALRAALAQHALVTVVGMAGVGKTALARALAAQAVAPPGRPACLVELAALAPQDRADDAGTPAPPDAAPIASAIAGALALALAAGPPVENLLLWLRQGPALQLPALLVLDNCEHLARAAAQLVSLMQASAPALRILATSQVPLRAPQEHLLRLEPLPVLAGSGLAPAQHSAAVALFVARAAARVPGFALGAANAGDLLEICRRLEGIPLALELAAARVPLLGTVGLLHRLDERLRLLARAGAEGAAPGPPRQQALRAALDWSWSLLPPAEQALLRRLGAFTGGFTASMAQQLASDSHLDEWAVLDGLAALVDKSLVVAPRDAAANPAEPRFTLLETVRDHARAQLQASAETDALARRHAELYEALAQAHAGALGGDQAGARRLRLEGEHDNLRAALAWATQHDPRLGLRLAAALMPFWRERGHHTEALQHCARLLERSDAQADAVLRLPVQLRMAMLAQELGDAVGAQAAGEAALASAQRAGDRRGEANAHAVLAHAAGLRNEVLLRRERYLDSLRIYRQLCDARLIAEGLNNVASCWCDEGQPQRAEPLLQEALPLVRTTGYKWLEGAILHTLAEVYCARGDFAAARRHLEDSLVLRRGLQHKFHLVLVLQALAMVALRLGRSDDAALELREALSLCASHDFAAQAWPCLATAAAWAAAQGRGPDAAALIGSVDAGLRDHPQALPPADLALHAQSRAQARTLLDAPTFERHRRDGLALTREQALRRALAMLDAGAR